MAKLTYVDAAPLKDGSGDTVMWLKVAWGNPTHVLHVIGNMRSVLSVTSEGKEIRIVFKGRLDNPMGMFNIIHSQVAFLR